jgi:hypothetical protein
MSLSQRTSLRLTLYIMYGRTYYSICQLRINSYIVCGEEGWLFVTVKKIQFFAVFRIRDILIRIKILGSVHWIPDPNAALFGKKMAFRRLPT